MKEDLFDHAKYGHLFPLFLKLTKDYESQGTHPNVSLLRYASLEITANRFVYASQVSFETQN